MMMLRAVTIFSNLALLIFLAGAAAYSFVTDSTLTILFLLIVAVAPVSTLLYAFKRSP